MKIIRDALKKTFSLFSYKIVGLSIFLIVLFINYFIFSKTTSWGIFWQSNKAIYNWLQIILTFVNAGLIAISIPMLFYIIDQRKKNPGVKGTSVSTLVSLVFSAAATGCPVCGAFLLPMLGIAASLTALPLGGLEIKFLSILVLFYAINEYAKIILGLCKIPKEKIISLEKGLIEVNLKKTTLYQLKPLVIFTGFLLIVYILPKLPSSLRVNFKKGEAASLSKSNVNSDNISAQINPPEGYEINATYGDIGPKMLALGVIDLEKFKAVYDQSGQPLTEEQMKILKEGWDQKIKITPENSYFLLNFFWAYGLANKTKILEEGEMVKNGQDQAGGFASTGGWSLSRSEPMSYYSAQAIMPMTPEQEKLTQEVAGNIYRPCCANSTAFPDCNHGMALLGVLELMAAEGAGQTEMYQAAKYFSAFWFPSNYYDLALYFKNKEGLDFAQIDPKILLSQAYSSAQGWQEAKQWLTQNGVVKEPPKTGGSCGV